MRLLLSYCCLEVIALGKPHQSTGILHNTWSTAELDQLQM